ncbi:MAG: hypothetical protein PF495_05765, partial [Spirochaetales bacterium]|nr:hypothetical protein [Spirochaetales bacterium]
MSKSYRITRLHNLFYTLVEDYILKPYGVSEILDSVGRALAKNAQRKRKALIFEQMEASMEQLKSLEGIPGDTLSSSRIITLPQGILVDLERWEISCGEQQTT